MKIKRVQIPFEIKQGQIDEDRGVFWFEGYASTKDLDLVNDIVEPTAFDDFLAKQMPTLLWQHSHAEPLGIFTQASPDGKGLMVRGEMPLEDTFVSGRVVPQMKIKSIKAMSIGYVVREYEMVEEGRVRKIKKADLPEISLVTFPANPEAVITAHKTREKLPTEFAPLETPYDGKPQDAQSLKAMFDDSEKIIPRAVFSRRIRISIDGGDEQEKALINELYSEMEMAEPFIGAENVPLTKTEVMNLCVSDLRDAIRHDSLKLSRNAAGEIATAFLARQAGNDEPESAGEGAKGLEAIRKLNEILQGGIHAGN